MRTHTALHVLCGVIWNEWRRPVTGGNMKPLEARMDFEFDPLPDGFAEQVERRINDAIAADHPIQVEFLPRDTAVEDEDLIRTKVNLIPESVTEIRVVDIVGLDKQADGGTHVASTAEVGAIRVVKTESKGKGNKRLRIEVVGRPDLMPDPSLERLRSAAWPTSTRSWSRSAGACDSALVAWVAHDVLGPDRALAVTAVSPSLADVERACLCGRWPSPGDCGGGWSRPTR